MKLGAFDYLLKPLELAHLRELVARACDISRLMRVPAVTEDEPIQEPADVLVGRCPAMQDVYKAIGRVAPQDVTVLIRGESGTGKELVARAIYHHSRRAAAPFLAVNCAAIPETLLESELFGHEKGAFTGAERKRIGKFEQCSGGTLFLDEIGDMTPLTQTKILRVLQDQQFERVGGNETIQTDVRIIAPPIMIWSSSVAAGRFRSDLYYRLSVFPIMLPPLRERGDDLPLLVEHFLKRLGPELGKEVQEIAPETLDVLRQYALARQCTRTAERTQAGAAACHRPRAAARLLTGSTPHTQGRSCPQARTALPGLGTLPYRASPHRVDRALRRGVDRDGTAVAHPCAPSHRGEPTASGPAPGHYA